MKKLVIVVLKIAGVFALFTALSTTIGVLTMPEARHNLWRYLVEWVAAAIVFLAWPDRIADLLHIEDAPVRFSISARAFLRVGLVLIGASAFIKAASIVLLDWPSLLAAGFPWQEWPLAAGLVLQLLVPLALLLSARKISERLEGSTAVLSTGGEGGVACPSCGAVQEIDDETRFCDQCASPLSRVRPN